MSRNKICGRGIFLTFQIIFRQALRGWRQRYELKPKRNTFLKTQLPIRAYMNRNIHKKTKKHEILKDYSILLQ